MSDLQNDIDQDKIDEQTGLSDEECENEECAFDFDFPVFNNQLLKKI